MRVVFNIVAVVCLAVGLGGILWSGDWRLLLSFPVAFALGLADVVACRQCLGLVWWESLLPLILSGAASGVATDSDKHGGLFFGILCR